MNNPLKGASMFVMLALGWSANANVIDLFTTPQALTDVVIGGAGNSSQVGFVGNPTILGGFRDANVNALTGAVDAFGAPGICDIGDACSRLSISGGTLAFSNDSGVTGEARVDYDGDDSPAIFNPIGLQTMPGVGIDFVNQDGCPPAGCSFLTFQVLSADLGFDFSVAIYTDATNFTEFQLISAGGAGVTQLPFSEFLNPTLGCGGSGPGVRLVTCGASDTLADVVNINNVGAFTFGLNVPIPPGGSQTVDVDLQIGGIEKQGIPEPMSLALLGIGLVVGVGCSRRRNRNCQKLSVA